MAEDNYVAPLVADEWAFPAAGDTRFTWHYDNGRERLLSLYQKGKDKQWDSVRRIDWDLAVDPFDVLGTPEQSLAIYGSKQWEKLGPADRQELRQHLASWEFSQFLHGEQGAMICSARIVEAVPDLDSKFYAATQVMDEARHAEIFAKFLQDKIGLSYPINGSLQALLHDALNDSRWDMPYLGMQVLIEGLALAAFGILRDRTDKPLPKQILAYIMQDEARHVAFGRLALRDYYAQLSAAEIAEREEFVIEGCHLMRDRFRMQEVYENLGYDLAECMEYVDKGPRPRAFRSLLFARIVPCVRDIGLWGPKVRQAYDDMGVLDMANVDLVRMMESDEELAEQIDDEKREMAMRRDEIDEAVRQGALAD
ncbi:ferritin-like domain-containing protein [Solihabitans fulvus]|uniref:Ferritin-like domain-containing protein n=1 Tax=Solihabitans fulvus TaxID=1892852 RepID=A0A5B2WKK4_9PSEU|nr:ferritin-like domain-containing protein [Solihabitans fulvus]KAA2250949.1 ferritin-like domain-containing protein [Solihabitans fulvus]